jgi:glutamate dehydrogenase/leucine dehydrogenase
VNLLPLTVAGPQDLDPVVEAGADLEKAARRMGLEPSILQRLRLPEREVRAYLPETAFRVQHSTALGPSLGTVVLRPDALMGEVRGAAMAQTWQCALLDLPMGGAAGAILCDPDRLTERQLKSLAHRYVASLAGILGPTSDLLTPGRGCHDMIAGWMLRRLEPGTVLSRPAVAQGIFQLLRRILEERGATLAEQRVAIQGFGSTGRELAGMLHESRARVVALSDVSGGLYRDSGLNVPAVDNMGCSEGDAIDNLELLKAPCDILVLAAAPRQVNAWLAEKVAAGIVIEAVQGALLPSAEGVLEEAGRLVIPSLIARAGGTLSIFHEWMERVRGVPPAEFDCARLLHAWSEVQRAMHSFKVQVKQAALLVAIERVARTLRFD